MANLLLERFDASKSPAKKLVSFLKTPFKKLPPGTRTPIKEVETFPRRFLEKQLGKEETTRFIQQEKALRPTREDLKSALLSATMPISLARPEVRAGAVKTGFFPLRQVTRPISGLQAGVGAVVDIAKGKKKSLLKETTRGLALPEEVETITSRVPFQEFEQKGTASLIPRAITEAVEQIILTRTVFGGVKITKDLASKRVVGKFVKEFRPVLEPQFGSKGIKIVEKQLAKSASKLTPVELFKLSKKLRGLKLPRVAPTQPAASRLLLGKAGQVIIPFEPGDIVRIGKATGKIIKISGTQALISSAGKEITKSLTELQPLTPTPKQLKAGVIPAKNITGAFGAPLPPVKPPTPLKATPQEKATAAKTETNLRVNLIQPSTTPDFVPAPETEESVRKVISALKIAKPLRAEQEKIFTKARREKLAKFQAVGEVTTGEAGFKAQLGQLRGELPKVQFTSIRGQVTQQDLNNIFEIVKDTNKIGAWEKIRAGQGLLKIFGEAGGQVPTPGEIELLNKIFPKEFTDTLLNQRDLLEKLKEAGIQLANIPRSIMSSFDMSAPFRQGVFMMGRYPKQSFRAFKGMFKEFGSEKAYQAAQLEISQKSTYDLMIENNLALMDLNAAPTLREERFMSQWAEKIPVIGGVVRASGRAYTGYLNKVRADVFEDLVLKAESLGLNPRDNPALLQSLAKFINAGTGRGTLGAMERAAPILNGFFFSPKLMASRIQLLNPVFYVKLDPFVRREALKTLFTFIGAGMTILTIAKMSGIAEVGQDARSADFAKMKIGNTRIDQWGGFQQYLRLIAQLVTGEIVSSTSGKIITLGEGYRPLTRLEIIGRFFEYKEAPVASFAMNLLRGQNLFGEELDIPKEIGMRFVPMVMQDVYDLYKDQGILGLPLAPLGWFGVGLQTYESQSNVRKNPLLKKFDRRKKQTSNTLLKKFDQRR